MTHNYDSNLTSFDNSTCEEPLPWETYEIAVTVIPLTSIMIFIVLGNLLVTVAILTQRNLRTPSNIYILSLAITDLSVGLFILPFNVKDMIHGWMLNMPLCRFWLTADVTLCSSSILHILAIAVDRFRSINEGLRYATSRTKKSAAITCLALWFLALWIASPPVLGWNDWEGSCPGQCFLTKELGYIVHSATGAFFIPAIVMVGLYVRIYFLLRKKFRDRATMKCVQEPQSSHDLDQSSSGDTLSRGTNHASKDTLNSVGKKTSFQDESDCCTDGENGDSSNETSSGKVKIEKVNSNQCPRSETLRNQILMKEKRKHSEQISEILRNKKKYSLSKERKATITLGILIGAFLVCWAPFTLYYVTTGVLKSSNTTVFQVVTWLGYLNSALNPVIYTKYSPDFRKAFHKILSGGRSNY
jgi:hypothetical protein